MRVAHRLVTDLKRPSVEKASPGHDVDGFHG
jgi:hypothetical protein